jgi:hypothetical protein
MRADLLKKLNCQNLGHSISNHPNQDNSILNSKQGKIMSEMSLCEKTNRVPKIFNSLGNEDKISSRWIAKETDKKHKNVLRDIDSILPKLTGSNLSQSIIVIDSIGYHNSEKEYLIGLELAVIILSRYQGKKAELALNLVCEALHYYINKAPLFESEILELKKQIEILKSQKKIEKEKKSTYNVPIFDIDIFGNYYVSRTESREKQTLSNMELDASKILHMDKTMSGLNKKYSEVITSFIGSHINYVNTVAKMILNQEEKKNDNCA